MNNISQLEFHALSMEWFLFLVIGGESIKLLVTAENAEGIIRLAVATSQNYDVMCKDNIVYYSFD